MKKDFLIKYLILFFAIVLTISVLIPLAISIIIHIFPKIQCVISADGFLAYCGALISSFVAIVIALISLLQSNRETECQDTRDKENRLKEILPCLDVSVKKEGENTFCITIHNHSDSPALNVHLFEYPLFPIVSQEKKRARRFLLNSKHTTDLCIESSYFEINGHGWPTSLQLLYNDKDGNLISQDFLWHHDNVYEKDQEEYIIRKDMKDEIP